MGVPISNASNTPLNQNCGTLPDVSGALFSWFQPLTFTSIVKTVVGYQVVETPTNVTFQGVWQPFTAQQLSMKPEGQRQWKWFTVHAQPGLELIPDEVITYLGTQYRIKDKLDYILYGYVEYHLVEDYTGAGPNP